MTYTTDALVIREVAYSDNDKMLTLLTPEFGRVGVMAKGARSMRSKLMTASQIYSWGNYEIYTRGDHHWLREAALIEPFYGLRADLDRIALANYLCDVTYDATGENVPADDVLRVVLNSFYALANDLAPAEIIKGAFEFRIAAMSGYLPDLRYCTSCRTVKDDCLYLDVMNGCLICADCLNRPQSGKADEVGHEIPPTRIFLPIPPGVLAALRYILDAPVKRLFSFRIDDADETADFSRACESYLLNHFERGFQSLDFYHSIRRSVPGQKAKPDLR